ncbi:hypothetical protein FRC12_019997 [Ceratobasidium sp. 428]|nr:hypothetical protein FRC12_019997 [Ceratobasidium sp. 428]
MCQLLEIPELVNLVLGQMSRPDQARFLQVSRSAFYLAVPFVWHSLQTASVLFELVHGISYKSIPGSEGEVIELPDPLDDLHTARFRFYAGFVKKVILHRATNRIHDLPVKARYRTQLENFLNWQSLLALWSRDLRIPRSYFAEESKSAI